MKKLNKRLAIGFVFLNLLIFGIQTIYGDTEVNDDPRKREFFKRREEHDKKAERVFKDPKKYVDEEAKDNKDFWLKRLDQTNGSHPKLHPTLFQLLKTFESSGHDAIQSYIERKKLDVVNLKVKVALELDRPVQKNFDTSPIFEKCEIELSEYDHPLGVVGYIPIKSLIKCAQELGELVYVRPLLKDNTSYQIDWLDRCRDFKEGKEKLQIEKWFDPQMNRTVELIKDKMMIRMQDKLSSEKCEQILINNGFCVIRERRLDLKGQYLLFYSVMKPENETIEETLEKIMHDPKVLIANPVGAIKIMPWPLGD